MSERERVSLLQRGEGEDLVLLHGYLACKESFYYQIEARSARYRVTAFDFWGMGASAPPDGPWSVSDYADWTREALAALGIAFPHVVAHSFGGRVAVKCLSRGELFDRAVLTGCAGIVPRRTAGYRVRVGCYRAVRRLAPGFAERHFGSREYRTLPPLMRESYKKIVNEDLRGDAARITRPVLFVCGSEDKETPLSSQRVYVRAVRGSSLYVMEGCGHFAHLEDALAFNVKTEEFLRWESGRSSPTSRAACLRDTSL